MFELGQLLKESMEAEREVIRKSLNESAEIIKEVAEDIKKEEE